MKIITWNVNGIRARQAQYVELLETEKPDVICLQELKAEPAQIPESCVLPGYVSYWHGLKGYSGVALNVREGLFAESPQYSHPAFDNETRIVQARTGNLVVASVYVPNGGKDYSAKIEFLTALAAYSREVHAAGCELVLCGDLNVTRTDMDVHPKERKPNAIGQRADERELLEGVIGGGLEDIGRMVDPSNESLFTWWPPWRAMRQRNIGWRIDFILASKTLATRVQACRVIAAFGTSDHAPVMMTLG